MMPFMDTQTATSASTLDTARQPRRAGYDPRSHMVAAKHLQLVVGFSAVTAWRKCLAGHVPRPDPDLRWPRRLVAQRSRNLAGGAGGEVMMTRPAKVVAIEALGAGPTHEVIHDPVARMLADLFLLPDGTQISGDDLQACVARLVDATNAIKQLDQREAQ